MDMESTAAFLAARDLLIQHRTDYDAACREFQWPVFEHFNWALDYFDVMAHHNPAPALWLVDADGSEQVYSFAELSARSNQVANHLRLCGVGRGDPLLVMLGARVELWETLLAGLKLGALVIPATSLLTRDDLQDRLDRARVSHLVVEAEHCSKFDGLADECCRLAVGTPPAGWLDYAEARQQPDLFHPDGPTPADAPALLYFTSGTTSRPKMVLHSQRSYPVGHLSTLYWIGLRKGDVHLNISSPGWAKHAWSSVFAPWNAEACVMVHRTERFDAQALLDLLSCLPVTSLCAPPTAWRRLVQLPLARFPNQLRELVAAGEPLNPEVIEQVRLAWNLTIRDGFGQSETTAMIANTPGQPLKPGSMGRPLPGYRIDLLDADGIPGDDGEVALPLDTAPAGLMQGYAHDAERTAQALGGSHYRCGDTAQRDADGYLTFVGRADDVFKVSDYRISPFELESLLIEHPAVVEVAVIPSPDAQRLNVPKALVVLADGYDPGPELAAQLLAFARERLAPYKRIRRLGFVEVLPKTLSGKIRRVELRQEERLLVRDGETPAGEFSDEKAEAGSC